MYNLSNFKLSERSLQFALVLVFFCLFIGSENNFLSASQINFTERSKNQEKCTGDMDCYQKVLNVVFPKKSEDFGRHREKARLVLRYLPSFDGEMQINVSLFADGKLSGEVFHLPAKSSSIHSKLSEIRIVRGKESDRNPDRDSVDYLASKIQIVKTIIDDQKILHNLYSPLTSHCFYLTANESIVLDSEICELWYETLSESYHFKINLSNKGKEHAIQRSQLFAQVQSAIVQALPDR